MKKSILILVAVVISLIGVNAQQDLSERKGKVVILEKTNQELYTSMFEDFENWYKETTNQEMIEDNENLNLYNDLYESFELAKKVEEERIKDEEYDDLFSSLKNDFEMYQMLSVAEIKF